MLEYWADETLTQQIERSSDIIVDSLEAVALQYGCQLRGRGMIWGLDFGDGEVVNKITQECFRQGLIIESAGAEGHVVKLLPALNIPHQQLRDGLIILRRAIATVVGVAPTAATALPVETASVFETFMPEF